MNELLAFIIAFSKRDNIWVVNQEEKEKLHYLTQEALFPTDPGLEIYLLQALSQVSLEYSKGNILEEHILFDFTNYILGPLLKEDYKKYSYLLNSLKVKIPKLHSYNTKSLKKDLQNKLFRTIKEEFEYALTVKSTIKKLN